MSSPAISLSDRVPNENRDIASHRLRPGPSGARSPSQTLVDPRLTGSRSSTTTRQDAPLLHRSARLGYAKRRLSATPGDFAKSDDLEPALERESATPWRRTAHCGAEHRGGWEGAPPCTRSDDRHVPSMITPTLTLVFLALRSFPPPPLPAMVAASGGCRRHRLPRLRAPLDDHDRGCRTPRRSRRPRSTSPRNIGGVRQAGRSNAVLPSTMYTAANRAAMPTGGSTRRPGCP